MTNGTTNSPKVPQGITHLARLVLTSFVLTFIVSRVVVFLIMSGRIPDLFLHVGGTHVHHLNFGIFLLAGNGAYLLLWRPVGRKSEIAAVIYGIGMGLTFDEFGMWLHLGGGYWQRASLDAVTVAAGAFGLIAFAPSLKRFRPHNWLTGIIVAIAVAIFFWMLAESFKYAGRVVGPKVRGMESTSPP
jgi:hypothetical protein